MSELLILMVLMRKRRLREGCGLCKDTQQDGAGAGMRPDFWMCVSSGFYEQLMPGVG
jgi:hypothetical protein